MKNALSVIILLSTMLTTQATAQKYYARQYLVGLKEASKADEEPPVSKDPVGPCKSPFASRTISGSAITFGRYVATRIPAQMCWGGDVLAPTGTKHMVLQNDENMVIYAGPGGSGPRWSPGTQYAGSRTLATQPDGNVQLLRDDGSVVWSTGTAGNPGAFAALTQTGSLVVMSANGRAMIWSTNTDVFDPSNVSDGKDGDIPGNIVPSSMERNDSVVSPNGKYRLSLQDDSNLVLYRTGGGATWSAGIQYSDAYRIVTLPTGDVQAVRANGSVVWHTATAGSPGARLRVQDDGDVVVYASDGKTMLWHSNTAAADYIRAG
jgi:hypothetical protein